MVLPNGGPFTCTTTPFRPAGSSIAPVSGRLIACRGAFRTIVDSPVVYVFFFIVVFYRFAAVFSSSHAR